MYRYFTKKISSSFITRSCRTCKGGQSAGDVASLDDFPTALRTPRQSTRYGFGPHRERSTVITERSHRLAVTICTIATVTLGPK